MSVVLGRIQSDGYSYSDTLWSPSGTWSYEEAVENDDDTISARSYFEDGTVWENGTQLSNYTIKATPNRIGDTRLDETPIGKSLTALRIYAERVPHQSFLDFLVSTGVAFVDPRVVIDPTGAYDVVVDGGVDNTGVADITTAVQAILNSNTKVYFPSGTYLVNDAELKVHVGNTLIFGDGELITTNATADFDILSLAYTPLSGELTIDGLTINHQGTGTFGNCINYAGAENNVNTTIQNCTFRNHLSHIRNACGGSPYDDTQKFLNMRHISNTYINTGRIAIETNDRNHDTLEQDTSVVGFQVLYNNFLFDTTVGQVHEENDHMFLSLTGGDDTGGDASQTMDSVVIGNYIENVNVGMELNNLTNANVRYNHMKNVDRPMFGVSTNKHVAYNYFECEEDRFFLESFGTDNIYEYNQIVGYVQIDNNVNLTWRNNSIYVKWYHKPFEIITSTDTLVNDNYFEVYGTDEWSSILVAKGAEVDNTVEIKDNKIFMVLPADYSNLTANADDATAVFTNNVDTSTRETLFPRVMPKMFK